MTAQQLQQLRQIADQVIPPAHNKFLKIRKRFSTGNIVDEVIACYNTSKCQLKALAPFLEGDNVKDTCRNIWQFVKDNIRYQLDPEGLQLVKEPAKTWADGWCDCKSYSIFIASLLAALDIKGCFRFVSFNSDPNPTHVYIVVRNKGQNIIIDDVMPRFNAEKPYTHKKDYCMTGLYRVSGLPDVPTSERRKPSLAVIGCGCSTPTVGRFGPDPAHKGRFTAKANRAGMGVQQFAKHVLSHESQYPTTTIREAVWARNAKTRFHHVSGFPVIDNDAAVGGLFDNITSAIKKTLDTGQADKYLIQLAPALLYRYIPNPNLKFTGPGLATWYNSLPATVRTKAMGCDSLINYMHHTWGQDSYHIGHTLHHTLVASLGMEPQHYLALVISSTIDTFKNTTSTAVGSLPVIGDTSGAQSVLNAITAAGGSATGASSVPGAQQAGKTSPAQFILDAFQMIAKVNLPSGFDVKSIAPAPGDWTGYSTRLPTFVVTPTPADPLGAGINNGLYDSNGKPLPGATQQNNIPVVDQSGNVVNQPKTAGIGPIVGIAIAGAALAMFMGHKKKKGGRK